MMHEIGVERVVAGDEHHQRPGAAPAGTATLLPERRDRPGETGDDDRVEPGDVDAELERVGGRDAEQATVGEGRLELAAVLGQVSGAVGGDPVDQVRGGGGEQSARGDRGRFGAVPGPHERERAGSFHDEIGEQARGFAAGGAAHGCTVFPGDVGEQRWFPQGDGARTGRGAVLGHLPAGRTDQPGRGRTRLRQIYERSVDELRDVLPDELERELQEFVLPLEGVPTESEMRVAQAQLVGWLEGLFHGIQAAMVAQQQAAMYQLQELRRRGLPPGMPGGPGGPGGPGAQEGPGMQMPGRRDPDRPGQYL